MTDDQRQALQGESGIPIEIIDPATNKRYVLLDRTQFAGVRSPLEQGVEHQSREVDLAVPPGILRSQQAFWARPS